ncbi:hypothetical protein SAMN05518855_1005134 [Paenibacillus sp. CF384]|nr:hypothetical protein SAMN05518855_1005134 [Paenibacillus sp. CF384]
MYVQKRTLPSNSLVSKGLRGSVLYLVDGLELKLA